MGLKDENQQLRRKIEALERTLDRLQRRHGDLADAVVDVVIDLDAQKIVATPALVSLKEVSNKQRGETIQ